LATREAGEWMGADKILSHKNSAYIPIATPRVTHEQAKSHTNISRDLRNKAWKARKQRGSEMEATTDKAEQNRALQQPTGIYDQEVRTSGPSPSPTGRYCRNFRQNLELQQPTETYDQEVGSSGPSPRLNGRYCRNFRPPTWTYSLRVGTSWTAQKKRPRVNSKLSIDGSPKPLGALRRNFGEMMNTPRRGYAPKITASNSLQPPDSQILAKNTMN
jgi:hypothetical protein